MAGRQLSKSQARRIALAAQGFNVVRPKRVTRQHLVKMMERLNLLQLDSVPVIIRTQYMPAFSRLGPYKTELLEKIAYAEDLWFEAWSHEATLVPVETEPWLRWNKARNEAGETWRVLKRLSKESPEYIEDVYEEVASRGPLAPGELSDPRRQDGEWWGGRSLGSWALDWLFRVGRLGIRRRGNFEKVFDLLENIVPAKILSQATPTEEDAHRELLLRSARAYGIGTAACLADYYRLPIRESRKRLAELVEDGQLEEVVIEGWSKPAFRHSAAKVPRSIKAAALLSPFDPVVWNRERALQLFDFDYKIEIYVPAAKRRYGYYVLPFLLNDQIVGRVDLKTHRKEGYLEVKAAYAEPDVDHEQVAESLAMELNKLATLVGVDQLKFGRKGNLMKSLRAIAI